MGVAKMPTLPKICPTYPAMMKLDTFIPYLKKIQKHVNHVKHPSSSTGISIFLPVIRNLSYQELQM